MAVDWSFTFGGALLRPKTAKAKEYCAKNGTYFDCADVYFVEGYGEFALSEEPVPPHVQIVDEMVEAPSLGGLSDIDKEEICRYWAVLK